MIYYLLLSQKRVTVVANKTKHILFMGRNQSMGYNKQNSHVVFSLIRCGKTFFALNYLYHIEIIVSTENISTSHSFSNIVEMN